MQNIQYLKEKKFLLSDFLYEEEPHIVCLCEHGLKNEEIEQLRIHPEYDIISYFSRKKYKGGGVIILVHKSIKSIPVNIERSSEEKVFEYAMCLLPDLKIRVIAIYRSPSSNVNDFLDRLNKMLDNLSMKEQLIIAGDFNINLDSGCNDKQVRDFLNIMKENGCKYTVSEYTRITETTASKIDNVFTNVPYKLVQSQVLENALSDHLAIESNICTENFVKTSPENGFFMRNHNDPLAKSSFANFIIDTYNSDLGKNAEEFFTSISHQHNLYFPEKFKAIKNRKNVISRKER